jgi:hypothetical protein
MPFADHVQKNIDAFLSAIAPVEDAYQNDSFSYLSLKGDDAFVLIQATLYLNSQPPKMPEGKFETTRIRAGHFYFRNGKCNAREVIEALGRGTLPTPHGDLQFPTGANDSFGANFYPFHEIGQNQRRLAMLSVLGAESSKWVHANQPHLDWEARAADTPFEGLSEVLSEFQPGVLGGVNRVDIAALDLAGIDARSIIEGETATLSIRAPNQALAKRTSVGFRVLDQGRVVRRGRLHSDALEWRSEDGICIGTAKLDVPRAGVVHAYALYDGIVYHHYFFGDPKSFQNPRRAAYETFDPQLGIMNDIFSKARTLKPDSKDFEAAIPWLFWMLGFAPAYIGGPPRMREAMDFLASTPNGHIAVVECTTGLLKDDSKLQRLHDRTEAVRRNLDSSSTRDVRVLPVIVTAKTVSEIKPDIEQAEKLGVYVIDRDGIERLLQQTMFPQDANQLYERAEQAVAQAIAKYEDDRSDY